MTKQHYTDVTVSIYCSAAEMAYKSCSPDVRKHVSLVQTQQMSHHLNSENAKIIISTNPESYALTYIAV